MKEGTVKFFNSEKGFGFIIPTDGTEDIFVHRTGLKEGVRLTEGDKVNYDEAQGKKGMNAVNVEKI
ncbi:MAG: cold-shock protein [Bacteroidales bacterium]|jgi:cold shock protein|nr:cold-shock protein [Bacteroidales bacterium]MDD3910790.1 cold-shock protein [Bacteroidales bacterium]MDD4421205.1 cold-shock protein [Bacteroidales bacterium]HNY05112.1 cold-shock protein [Candidatus Egerieousia sp.]HPT05430.1 cold-shock protein [Candidatus Egerieousia sp.]